ncbi:MAG: bile acid:sodium symporter family protein [Microthrixaceae bacterium]
MEVIGLLFNLFLVVMIVTTMVSAGFTTTFSAIGSVLSRFGLVVMVLATGLLLRPAVGWGLAELFSLDTPAYIAMILLAVVPGAPLGVKFVMSAKGDVTTGAVFQVLLAVVASFTFAPTANWILETADLGDGVSLPVGDLLRTIVFLQVLPFVVGLLIRRWNEKSALEWNEFAQKVIGPSFLAVVVLGVLGSWQMIIDLIGDRVLLAGALFSVIMVAIGYTVSTGGYKTRAATSMIQPGSNSGPSFAAVAIAFDGDPAILGAVTAILFMQIVVTPVIGSWMGNSLSGEPDDDEVIDMDATEGAAESDGAVAQSAAATASAPAVD